MTFTSRKRPTELHDSPEHRSIPIDRIELRDATGDDNTIVLEGYASTFESYDMYGGPANGAGWIERIDRGAFDRTLREGPDLHLLINHAGMPLARTKSGTLQLSTDGRGLKVVAQLDKRDPEVQSLSVKMARGDMDEMSFAFRVKAQAWEATDEYPDDNQALRTITEVSLHKGDVSVVNFGANPTTSVGIRSISDALQMIAECDESELVEARGDGDVLQRAKEKLGATTHVETLNVTTTIDGVITVNEAREISGLDPIEVGDGKAEEAGLRAWLFAEAGFKAADAWLEAERTFAWLEAEKRVTDWLEAERLFNAPKKGISLRLARALVD